MGWSSQVIILHRAGMTNYQQSWLEQQSHQPSWLGKMGWNSQAISLPGWNLSMKHECTQAAQRGHISGRSSWQRITLLEAGMRNHQPPWLENHQP
jgi:hypothetical protein